jgi:DNA-binding XRE family transcriptional regulator
MQAVVKTHHINIHIEADRIPNSLLTLLKNEYGNDLKIIKKRKTKREESIIADTSDWFKNIKAITKPSDNLKIYRTNLKLSQGKLAKIIGVLPTHISEMERGKRGISKGIAKKLAKVFEVTIEKFI